jgi:hypothetical protein
MSHDEQGHCFFARQPSTAEETDAAIRAAWASCCGAIRYSGSDRETLVRLAEMGLADQCDSRLLDEPKPVSRDHVSFEFTLEVTHTSAEKARIIAKYLSESLANPRSNGGTVRDLRISGVKTSFRYLWGVDTRYSVTFVLEPLHEQRWLLRLLRDDGLSTVGFANGVQEALERDQHFAEIRWFTEEQWRRNTEKGRLLPY